MVLNRSAGSAYWPRTLIGRHSLQYNVTSFEWQMDAGEGMDYWPKQRCPASSVRVVSHWFTIASVNIYVAWVVYVNINSMTYTVAHTVHWLNREAQCGWKPRPPAARRSRRDYQRRTKDDWSSPSVRMTFWLLIGCSSAHRCCDWSTNGNNVAQWPSIK